ncbi:MAG: VOC family protein [Verrucomicrobiota bacterium]
MKVLKVKYAIWVKDMKKSVQFYSELFGGEVSLETPVWSEVTINNSIIGIHDNGSGERTWTGMSFQLDDLREGIKRLEECGGALTREPTDTEEDPLHLAMCVDPDGNEFMMTQAR